MYLSALVGLDPDALLFRIGDQVITEHGMGNGDQLFRPFPGRTAHQVHAAVLSDDVVRLAAGVGDDVAGGQQRVDAGLHISLLIRKRGRQTDKGLAAVGQRRTLKEVQLTAGAADLAGAGAFGADLSVQVYGDTVVDGNKIILLAHVGRVVAVADGIGDHAGVFPYPIIQIRRADGQAEDALVAIQLLLVVGDLAGLVHIQIAVAQHLGMDAQVPQITLGDHLAHRVRQRTNAQLQRGAVHHVLHHVLGDLHLRLVGGGGLDAGQRAMGPLYDHIHVADVDALVQTAVDPGQVLVDLQNDHVCLVQRRTGGGRGTGKVEVAVLVHGGHSHHGYVDGEELAVIPAEVAEHHGIKITQSAIAELALIAGHMPAVVDKVPALGVALHHLDRVEDQIAADLDLAKLILSLGNGGVHQRRKARAHGDVDPVAAFYHPCRFIGGA